MGIIFVSTVKILLKKLCLKPNVPSSVSIYIFMSLRYVQIRSRQFDHNKRIAVLTVATIGGDHVHLI